MHRIGQLPLLLLLCLPLGTDIKAQNANPVPPVHPATAEQVRKLLSLSHAAEQVSAVINREIEAQKKVPNIFPDAFWNDCQTEFAKTDWVAIAVPIYQRYLSEEEANTVIAFYSTPVGQKMLGSSQVITKELSTQGGAIGREIGGRVAEKYKTQIEENMKKLQQDKPSGSAAPPN